MEYKDYYKIIGVERNASADQIRRAYRQLAKKYHPDLHPGDKVSEDKFKQVNEAYEVLSDTKKRAKYDELGESYSRWQQNGGRGDFDSWSSQAPGGYRVDTANMDDLFGGQFSDFFNMFFGQMGGVQQQQQQRRRSVRTAPRSYEQPVQITFDEAFKGGERLVQLEQQRLTVKIPPGAATGTKVRMAGVGPGGADILLGIEVLPDARFERKGDDLYTDITIDLYTAVLGGKAAVSTPSGNVMLTITPGTQPGQVFRLSGQGMPRLSSKPLSYGDLYARAQVQLPRTLTPHQRELFEKLRLGG